eukprot:6201539-Pleurochrysis_carterae.AAC.3
MRVRMHGCKSVRASVRASVRVNVRMREHLHASVRARATKSRVGSNPPPFERPPATNLLRLLRREERESWVDLAPRRVAQRVLPGARRRRACRCAPPHRVEHGVEASVLGVRRLEPFCQRRVGDGPQGQLVDERRAHRTLARAAPLLQQQQRQVEELLQVRLLGRG